MRRQAVNRAAFDPAVRDQMQVLTGRPTYVLQPRESLQKYLGKMTAGGTVLIPEGVWTFYDDLVVPDDVWIVGCGWKSRIEFKNEHVVRVSGARAQLRDLCVKGDSAGPRTTDGTITVTGAEAVLSNLLISECYNGVAVLTGGVAVTVIGCHFTGKVAGAKGILLAEEHGFLGWNYFVAAGGLDIHDVSTAGACIGNRAPGGAFTIPAAHDFGNWT